jgi:hypothetical protein
MYHDSFIPSVHRSYRLCIRRYENLYVLVFLADGAGANTHIERNH